ncbi:hypothetical protein VPH35_100170 [Triticum aestivum]
MDGFSFYVVEVEEKTLVVLDPAETSIHDDEMSIKHEDNATLVLKTLRTDSWIYLGHYWRSYNGLYLQRQLGEYELAYLKKQFAYEVISMKGNKGELPSFMIQDVLF